MVFECPQCAAAEYIDAEYFADRSKLELECAKCGHISVVPAPTWSEPGAGTADPPRETLHTGQTTVVEFRTRLPEGKKVAVVAMKGPTKGAIFPITKPEVTLGRVETDLIIPDNQISAKHCTLEVRDSSAVLRDLGSTNGIFVGTEQVKTAQIEHLSEFRIGGTTLMFTVTPKE